MDMTPETTFDQDLSTIVAQLPPPVRAFFVSGKVEIVAKRIFDTYKLHVDQGAIVEREIILLLLGLKSPVEFALSLESEGAIPVETVRSIVNDLNQQVFIPLQQEMRRADAGKSAAPPAPQVNEPVSKSYTPPKLPTPFVQQTPQAPRAPTPVVQVAPQVQKPVVPATQPAPKPSTSSMPPVVSRVEPKPQASSAPLPPKVVLPDFSAQLDLPVGEAPSQAPVAKLPANLPGAMSVASMPPGVIPPGEHFAPPARPMQPPPVPTPSPPRPPVPSVASAKEGSPPVPKPSPPPAPAKPYSADPYREPIG